METDFVVTSTLIKAFFYSQIYFASASGSASTKLSSLGCYQPLAEMRWLCKGIYRGT